MPTNKFFNQHMAPIRLKQSHLDEKLHKYAAIAHNNPRTTHLDKVGNCNGWSFVFQYYLYLNQEKEFYDILRIIAHWNESRIQLKTPLSQYNRFKISDRLIEKYKTVGDLFEQTFNDVAWFQQSQQLGKVSAKGQKDRVSQWNIIQDANLKLNKLFSVLKLRKLINNKQLTQILENASLYPETWIDLGYFRHTQSKSGHAISIYITKEGNFKFYDSNHDYVFPIKEESSAKKVAESIIKSHSGNIILKSFSLYKFARSAAPETTGNPLKHQNNPISNKLSRIKEIGLFVGASVLIYLLMQFIFPANMLLNCMVGLAGGLVMGVINKINPFAIKNLIKMDPNNNAFRYKSLFVEPAFNRLNSIIENATYTPMASARRGRSSAHHAVPEARPRNPNRARNF